MSRPWFLICGGWLLVPALVSAQGVGQQRTIDDARPVDELVVRERADTGSPTARSATEAREALRRVAGAIGFVEAEDFADQFTQSIGDILELTPGVFADPSAQRETRISIRGSGLSSGFERRGLNLYRDGVPITRASGSTEFQEVDPLSIHYVEVYKGANGMRFGGTALGGAVNLVTPTGRTGPAGIGARLEYGSFDTARGHVRYTWADDRYDGFMSVTGLATDGYREHSGVDSVYGFGNLGVRLGERAETRFYVTALSDNFELSGSLALQDALDNPRAASRPVTVGPPGGPVRVLDPGPVADGWDRNLDVLRLANRTVVELDRTTLEGGAWYSRRELDHAITRFAGIIDQSEDEFGAFGRVSNDGELAGRALASTVGFSAQYGDNDAKRWGNDFGARAELRQRSEQRSTLLQLYAEADLALSERLNLVGGLHFGHAERRNTAILNDTSGSESYRQWSPRIGLIGTITEGVQVFANLSRDFEPPTLADLTTGGVLAFTPLRLQRSWTAEVGSRGEHGFIAWDVAIYQSRVDAELIRFGVPGATGFISFTDNAGDTIHRGVELGMDWRLGTEAMRAGGLEFLWRHNWTYNDFRFDRDPSFGDNRLAGVPRHLYVSVLTLEAEAGWYVGADARWVPAGPWVDFANTVRAPGYDIYGLRAGWRFDKGFTLFASAENLFDQRYISNVGTNANQSLQNAALFTPGRGRAIFAGVSWNL
jgi:iron complex outermembrane receptor protein